MTAFAVRDAVERLPRYRGLVGERPPVRLDGNENPLGPSPRALEVLATIDPDVLSRYPDVTGLRADWAARLGVEESELLLTSGSGPALALAAELVLDPGDHCVLLEPSFELYAWAAHRRDAAVVAVGVGRDLAFPLTAVREALDRHQPGLVMLGSPDNPTGVGLPRRSLEALAARHRSMLFVVDEAYAEFTGKSLLPGAVAHPNVLVARTFSKAMGLAGERIGGLVGAAELIERLARINVPYPVTGVAARVAIAALADRGHVRRTVRQVRRSTRRLLAGLEEIGAVARGTAANFVLLDAGTADRAGAVTRALADRGVAVRDRSYLRNFAGMIRISAGTDEETERVLDEMRLLTTEPPEALLFDMDGTLVDVSRSYDEAIYRTVCDFLPPRRRPARDAVLAVKRDPAANDDIDATLMALSRLGVRGIERRVVAERFQAAYLGRGDTPGLRARERWLLPAAVLKALARRLPLAVVTGRPRDEAAFALEQAGTAAFFAAVVTADDVRRKKPDPAPVRRALRMLGVRRAWMVGDSPADLLSAAGAGIHAVAIARGEPVLRVALRSLAPLAVLDAARELADVFDGRNRLAAAGAKDGPDA